MSHIAFPPKPLPKLKVATLHWSVASMITKIGSMVRDKNVIVLLCCPVLKPQIMGDPTFPGEVMLNWSVKQSPMAEPTLIGASFVFNSVVPWNGPAMSNVWKWLTSYNIMLFSVGLHTLKSNLILQTSLEHLQMVYLHGVTSVPLVGVVRYVQFSELEAPQSKETEKGMLHTFKFKCCSFYKCSKHQSQLRNFLHWIRLCINFIIKNKVVSIIEILLTSGVAFCQSVASSISWRSSNAWIILKLLFQLHEKRYQLNHTANLMIWKMENTKNEINEWQVWTCVLLFACLWPSLASFNATCSCTFFPFPLLASVPHNKINAKKYFNMFTLSLTQVNKKCSGCWSLDGLGETAAREKLASASRYKGTNCNFATISAGRQE